MANLKNAIKEIAISEVKPNPNNPRSITEEKFNQLVQSIKDFPQMLNLRPLILDSENVVLGGNMRLRACLAAGLTKVPVIQAEDLTEEQKKEFIIKDNVSFGSWDWDALANEWDSDKLNPWGLSVWQPLEFEDSTESESEKPKEPKGSDDDYSVFEIVMIHENKLRLLALLNKIKEDFNLEKQEQALVVLMNKFYENESN